jgi:hypothetical protein
VGLGAIVPAEAGVQALPESAQGAKGGAQGVAQNAAPAPIPAAPPQGGTGAGAFPAGSVLAGEVFRQSAAALQLPADSLSTALLAFSRFFSLPPSKALFTALRRETLDLPKMPFSSTPSTTSAATLEARAMAAAAAFDKGVALTGEALERYARFLAPPSFPAEGDDPAQGRQDGEKEAPTGGGGSGDTGEKKRRDREKAPLSEELSALAEEQAKEKKLDFLNRIPGKNGQYWAVFPFDITVKGMVLKVFFAGTEGRSVFVRRKRAVNCRYCRSKKAVSLFSEKK